MKMTAALVAVVLLFITLVNGKAPLMGQSDPDRIEGQYIVLFHENATVEEATLKWENMGDYIIYKYRIGETFKGFSAKLTPEMLENIRNDNLVQVVHYDGIVTAYDCSARQTPATWGICRVSHWGEIPTDGLSNIFNFDPEYAGQNVNAYVLDTGIMIEHNEFRGDRARHGANFADSVLTDQNGHGTHCAGTIIGETHGIARKANAIAVKVLGRTGGGSLSGVIAGINWVTEDYLKDKTIRAVASMSLGATQDGGINAAIRASSAEGVIYSVAGGNNNGDACNFFPASSPFVITAGASDLDRQDRRTVDTKASFSNWGRCLDIWAPGVAIESASIRGIDQYSLLSGTSMACPHVSGVIAAYLSQFPDADLEQTREALKTFANSGILHGDLGDNSPNLLLYNGCGQGK